MKSNITSRNQKVALVLDQLDRSRCQQAMLAEMALSQFMADGNIAELAKIGHSPRPSEILQVERVSVWLFEEGRKKAGLHRFV